MLLLLLLLHCQSSGRKSVAIRNRLPTRHPCHCQSALGSGKTKIFSLLSFHLSQLYKNNNNNSSNGMIWFFGVAQVSLEK
jgi:hypothetical protein